MFVKGQVYKRSAIHERFGGQRQGGISTPAHQPVILLFTSEAGTQHGYEDGWTSDGRFFYTGEGQYGDMEFTRGNAAIRDHVANGKSLHLFERTEKGWVRYLGEMVYIGHRYREGSDTAGRKRQMIVFELRPIEAAAP
jgi:5-methylcytosine-specific restriction protein A